jgi:predicted molibdopterin-dependent oxidoreductase YjgC
MSFLLYPSLFLCIYILIGNYGRDLLPFEDREVKGEMKNIEMRVEGDTLTIVVDLKQEFGLSSSGKSITVASTEGNVSVPEREDIKIGLNIYRPRSKNER